MVKCWIFWRGKSPGGLHLLLNSNKTIRPTALLLFSAILTTGEARSWHLGLVGGSQIIHGGVHVHIRQDGISQG